LISSLWAKKLERGTRRKRETCDDSELIAARAGIVKRVGRKKEEQSVGRKAMREFSGQLRPL